MIKQNYHNCETKCTSFQTHNLFFKIIKRSTSYQWNVIAFFVTSLLFEVIYSCCFFRNKVLLYYVENIIIGAIPYSKSLDIFMLFSILQSKQIWNEALFQSYLIVLL